METIEQEVQWRKSHCDYIAPYGCLAIDCLYLGDGTVEWCYGRCSAPQVSTLLNAITEEQFLEMAGQEEFDGVRERMLAELESWKSGENN